MNIIAGERVKDMLSELTTYRFSAAFAVTLVTAAIQSSSITTVLVVGYITAGFFTEVLAGNPRIRQQGVIE